VLGLEDDNRYGLEWLELFPENPSIYQKIRAVGFGLPRSSADETAIKERLVKALGRLAPEIAFMRHDNSDDHPSWISEVCELWAGEDREPLRSLYIRASYLTVSSLRLSNIADFHIRLPAGWPAKDVQDLRSLNNVGCLWVHIDYDHMSLRGAQSLALLRAFSILLRASDSSDKRHTIKLVNRNESKCPYEISLPLRGLLTQPQPAYSLSFNRVKTPRMAPSLVA
jgi:hypothetical protein